jgi:hypothetical protein
VSLLVLLLVAATPSNAWLDFPARDGQPAFRLRVTGGEKLTVQLDSTRPLDPHAALHLWVADAALVRRHDDDLRDASAAIAQAQTLTTDDDHREPECQARLTRFLSMATEQLRVLREEDPFVQVVVRFPGSGPSPAGLASVEADASGQAGLVLEGVMDLSGPVVKELALAAQLEPLASVRRAPGSAPRTVEPKLPLRSTLRGRSALELLLFATPQPQGRAVVFRPVGDGYRPFRRGEVGELGCFGVDGNFKVPAGWEELTPVARDFEGGALRYFEGLLVVGDGTHATRVPLTLDSPAATDFEVVDLQRVRGQLVLVAVAGGPSRLGNGMGQCGAGTERTLFWAHFDASFSLLKQQTVHLESCFESIEAEAIDGGWSLTDQSRLRRTAVRYDPKHPLAGLGQKHTPLLR